MPWGSQRNSIGEEGSEDSAFSIQHPAFEWQNRYAAVLPPVNPVEDPLAPNLRSRDYSDYADSQRLTAQSVSDFRCEARTESFNLRIFNLALYGALAVGAQSRANARHENC